MDQPWIFTKKSTVSAIYCSSASSLSDIIFLIDNINLIKIKVSLNRRFSFFFCSFFSFLFLIDQQAA